MRIAITGANGKVGSGIVTAALAAGHEVVAIDRAPAPAPHPGRRDIIADLADYDGLLRAFAGCDGLIHLAAIPNPLRDPDHVVHNNNVVGSYNAMRAAIESGITRLCQASSANAIGLSFSRVTQFDYFPVDEKHPPYFDDSYALSKWVGEVQAETLARRFDTVRIASLRFHLVIESREAAQATLEHSAANRATELYGYTRLDAAADACLKSLTADFSGHQIFYIVAPDTILDEPSLDVARRLHPNVPITKAMPGNASFFDSSKAERLLGWVHPHG